MNFSEAVNLFVSMVVQHKGLPFEVKLSDEVAKRIEDIEKNRNIEDITEDLKKEFKCTD